MVAHPRGDTVVEGSHVSFDAGVVLRIGNLMHIRYYRPASKSAFSARSTPGTIWLLRTALVSAPMTKATPRGPPMQQDGGNGLG